MRDCETCKHYVEAENRHDRETTKSCESWECNYERGMTESEARGFIQGKLNCMKRCDRFDCKNTDECDNCEYCYTQGTFGEQTRAFQLAIKALEKQIPKKPIIKSGESLVHINKGDKPHEWKINKWCSWCCPVCGWFVGERYNRVRNDGSIHPHDQRKSNYCNECGQAIDWSDEE